MRRALIFCVLALAVAGPAGAQDKKARPKAPPASPTLRGPVTAPPMSRATPPPSVDINAAQSLFLPSPIASAPVGGAPQQCRQSCAQTYYFCLSSDDGGSCSATWGQCRSACDAPTLVTSY
jgi:hypothetical protein